MNKRRTWLMMFFLALVLTAISQGQQSPVNKWETEIKKFEESDRQNPPAKGAVLFLGSSSIRGWQSLAEDFPGIKVTNRGFGGSEIADSTFYADRIVIPYRPRIVVFYAGDNDLANGKTPQQVFDDYKAFVSRVQRKLPTTRIAFISIKPSPARASLLQSMKDANALIKAYVSHDKSLIYIDVFTPMLRSDGSPRPELFGPDRLHMNREGYSLWKSVVAPYIR
jgi:lysophospholipase L1-like esterase